MRDFFQKPIFKKPPRLYSGHAFWPMAFILVLAVVFLFPQPALAAGIGDLVTEAVGKLGMLIINALGSLILLPLINFVVAIVGYNGFLDSYAVTIGWQLVRDLANMFFVVILLVIAFSTILNIANYSYKNTLFKLILMAILVNFSKTIMGFLIDFGQVIMLTFVNAFKDAAPVNLVSAFGIRDMLSLEGLKEFDNWEVTSVVVLGVIMIVVAIGLMLAYAAVLLYRIIALWVLIILSPLAFLFSAFSGTAKYASEFWSNFTKQLTTGVILAFFMWLSLAILAGVSGGPASNVTSDLLKGEEIKAKTGQQAQVSEEKDIEIAQWDRLYTYIIAIALLLMALNYAQQAGGFAGAFAGKISGKLSEFGAKAAKLPFKAYAYGARKISAGKVPGLKFMRGVDINPANLYKKLKHSFEEKKTDELLLIDTEAGKNLSKGGFKGLISGLGAPDYARQTLNGFLGLKGIGQTLIGSRARADEHSKAAEELEKKIKDLEIQRESGGNVDGALGLLDGTIIQLSKELNGLESNLRKYDSALENLSQERVTVGDQIKSLEEKEAKGQLDLRGKRNLDDLRDRKEDLDQRMTMEEGKLSGIPEVMALRTQIDRKKTDLQDIEGDRDRFKTIKDKETKAQMAKDIINVQLGKVKSQLDLINRGELSGSLRGKRDNEIMELDQRIARYDSDLQNPMLNNEQRQVLNTEKQTLINERSELVKYKPRTNEEEESLKKEKIKLEKQQGSLSKLQQKVEIKPYIDEAERDKLEKEIVEIERQAKAERAQADRIAKFIPRDLSAERGWRSLISEKQRNIDTDNEEELVSLAQAAITKKDPVEAAAVLLQAAHVGHLNELLNGIKSPLAGKNDDTGSSYKKGEVFDASLEGFHNFMDAIFNKHLGVSRQTTLSLQDDASRIAQEINHWVFSQAVGNRNGALYQRDDKLQQTRVAIEQSKADPETLIRRGNRLAWMEEKMIDKTDPDKGRISRMLPTGIAFFSDHFSSIIPQFDRMRFNKNLAYNLTAPQNLSLLRSLSTEMSLGVRSEFNRFLDLLNNYAGKSEEGKDPRKRASDYVERGERVRRQAGWVNNNNNNNNK